MPAFRAGVSFAVFALVFAPLFIDAANDVCDPASVAAKGTVTNDCIACIPDGRGGKKPVGAYCLVSEGASDTKASCTPSTLQLPGVCRVKFQTPDGKWHEVNTINKPTDGSISVRKLQLMEGVEPAAAPASQPVSPPATSPLMDSARAYLNNPDLGSKPEAGENPFERPDGTQNYLQKLIKEAQANPPQVEPPTAQPKSFLQSTLERWGVLTPSSETSKYQFDGSSEPVELQGTLMTDTPVQTTGFDQSGKLASSDSPKVEGALWCAGSWYCPLYETGKKAWDAVKKEFAGSADAKPSSGEPSSIGGEKFNLTAYAPCGPAVKCRIQGGPNSSRVGPDGKNLVRTLDDFRLGRSKYVTGASDPSRYGEKYVISKIKYWSPEDGKEHTLYNVPVAIHDTGGDFQGRPDKLDLALSGGAKPDAQAREWASGQPFLAPRGPNAIKFSPITQAEFASRTTNPPTAIASVDPGSRGSAPVLASTDPSPVPLPPDRPNFPLVEGVKSSPLVFDSGGPSQGLQGGFVGQEFPSDNIYPTSNRGGFVLDTDYSNDLYDGAPIPAPKVADTPPPLFYDGTLGPEPEYGYYKWEADINVVGAKTDAPDLARLAREAGSQLIPPELRVGEVYPEGEPLVLPTVEKISPENAEAQRRQLEARREAAPTTLAAPGNRPSENQPENPIDKILSIFRRPPPALPDSNDETAEVARLVRGGAFDSGVSLTQEQVQAAYDAANEREVAKLVEGGAFDSGMKLTYPQVASLFDQLEVARLVEGGAFDSGIGPELAARLTLTDEGVEATVADSQRPTPVLPDSNDDNAEVARLVEGGAFGPVMDEKLAARLTALSEEPKVATEVEGDQQPKVSPALGTTCKTEACVGGELGYEKSNPQTPEQLALKDEIANAEKKLSALKELETLKKSTDKAVTAMAYEVAHPDVPSKNKKILDDGMNAARRSIEKLRALGETELANKVEKQIKDLEDFRKQSDALRGEGNALQKKADSLGAFGLLWNSSQLLSEKAELIKQRDLLIARGNGLVSGSKTVLNKVKDYVNESAPALRTQLTDLRQMQEVSNNTLVLASDEPVPLPPERPTDYVGLYKYDLGTPIDTPPLLYPDTYGPEPVNDYYKWEADINVVGAKTDAPDLVQTEPSPDYYKGIEDRTVVSDDRGTKPPDIETVLWASPERTGITRIDDMDEPWNQRDLKTDTGPTPEPDLSLAPGQAPRLVYDRVAQPTTVVDGDTGKISYRGVPEELGAATPADPVESAPRQVRILPAEPPATVPETQTTPFSLNVGCSASIVDCLTDNKLSSDFASRQKFAEQLQIANYQGTGDQNRELIKRLSSSGLPVPIPSPRDQYSRAAQNYPVAGGSIVDFLSVGNLKSDFTSRAALYAREVGGTIYSGSAKQNTDLLKVLRAKGQ